MGIFYRRKSLGRVSHTQKKATHSDMRSGSFATAWLRQDRRLFGVIAARTFFYLAGKHTRWSNKLDRLVFPCVHKFKWHFLTIKIIRLLVATACLALFCSCATPVSVRPILPAEISFNEGAGRGNSLYVTVKLEDGEKLLFAVDTGMPETVFDTSLEPKLGKRLHWGILWYGYFGARTSGVYKAPKLFLGDTELAMGDRVHTDSLRELSGLKVKGILGMDCLKHYCIQLDFKTAKMRLLDPDNLNLKDLGNAFPLTTSFGVVFAHADFFGLTNASVAPDTGDFSDGSLKSGLFKKEMKEQEAGISKSPIAVASRNDFCFPKGSFGDVIYTNLMMGKCPLRMWLGQQNLIGLRLLARNLVTFDFPKGIMYLRPESTGPLPNDLYMLLASLGVVDGQPPKDVFERFQAYAKQKPGGALWLQANEFLGNLKKKNELPGWSVKDNGSEAFDFDKLLEVQKVVMLCNYPAIRTVGITKNGESFTYHYSVVKLSEHGPWKLQKAWQTDVNGQIVKEFPIEPWK